MMLITAALVSIDITPVLTCMTAAVTTIRRKIFYHMPPRASTAENPHSETAFCVLYLNLYDICVEFYNLQVYDVTRV
jgi:hypothetical protein